MRDHLCASGAVPYLLSVMSERGQDDDLTIGILDAFVDLVDQNIDGQV